MGCVGPVRAWPMVNQFRPEPETHGVVSKSTLLLVDLPFMCGSTVDRDGPVRGTDTGDGTLPLSGRTPSRRPRRPRRAPSSTGHTSSTGARSTSVSRPSGASGTTYGHPCSTYTGPTDRRRGCGTWGSGHPCYPAQGQDPCRRCECPIRRLSSNE